jgi:hypothetical protein
MFESVENIWIVWLTSLIVLAGFLGLLADRTQPNILLRLKRFHSDECGATYSLSFVMVFPFMVLICGLILETSTLLITKGGTMHAAFCAARSAAVWSTVNYPNEAVDDVGSNRLAIEKSHKAAVIAMTPWASGLQRLRSIDADSGEFLDAYKDYTSKEITQRKISGHYIRKKYTYAKQNTRVVLSYGNGNQSQPWLRDIRASVIYDASFVIPFIGRLLGATVKNGRVVYTIETTAALQNELPRNTTGHLGIRAVPGL